MRPACFVLLALTLSCTATPPKPGLGHTAETADYLPGNGTMTRYPNLDDVRRLHRVYQHMSYGNLSLLSIFLATTSPRPLVRAHRQRFARRAAAGRLLSLDALSESASRLRRASRGRPPRWQPRLPLHLAPTTNKRQRDVQRAPLCP